MKRYLSIIVAIAVAFLVAGPAVADSAFKADRATKLIDARAIDVEGKPLGTVSDLVIGENQQLSYVIIEKSDASGFVAVPFEVAQPRIVPDGAVVLAVTKANFDKATSFASSDWPTGAEGARGYRGGGMHSDQIEVNGIYTYNPYPM